MKHLPYISLLITAIPNLIQSRRLNTPSTNDPYKLLSPPCPEPSSSTPPTLFNDFISKNKINLSTDHVTIPCSDVILIPGGSNIIFEKGLTIEGKLTFEDNSKPIRIETPNILLRGYLQIGSALNPHQSRLTIALTEGDDDLIVTDPALGPYSPLQLGKRGFVVLGGQATIIGATDEEYTHLKKNVGQGAREITVGLNVSWKKGDTIAIASGIVRGQFTSSGVIQEVKLNDDGSMSFLLEKGVAYSHIVRYFEKTMPSSLNQKDPKMNQVWLLPEVVKLNRNVKILGAEGGTDGMGGYFTVAHSSPRQIIEGVEFVNMGQQGDDGRYPIHFHLSGYVPEGTRISKNSIHHSLQRCIVIQATHNVIINQNVAYHTHGHCFMTQDGIETGNKFANNLAMHVVTSVSDIKTEFEDNAQTDTFASAFYMASPSNDLVGNVVAGAQHTGFFYESHDRVKGESAAAQLPGYDTINVKHASFGRFENNLAHSVPIGLNPGYGRHPTTPVSFRGLTCWSIFDCYHSQSSTNVALEYVTAVDFRSNAVSALNARGFKLTNALLVGELNPPKDKSECGSDRIIAAIELSTTNAFTLQNVHFQKLSKRINCQEHNVALRILPSHHYHGSAIHSHIVNLSFDASVDHHYEIDAYPYILNVGGMGAGDLPPNGSIVTFGRDENFRSFVGESCTEKDLSLASTGVAASLYCPNSCWKSFVLEWAGEGEVVEYVDVTTGKRWRGMAESLLVHGVEKKTTRLTIPTGQYEVFLWKGSGGLVEVPIMKRYDVVDEDGSGCAGDVVVVTL